jgi:hypothetical protein
VRQDGAQWSVDPEPCIPELRPNMKHTQDAPWHAAKKQIASGTRELTAMWFLGAEKRDALLVREPPITRWKPARQGPRFDALLDVNRDPSGPPVRPARVTLAEEQWRRPEALEFFVDFETGGSVGCGHLEDGRFAFRCFTADALTEAAEADVIERWLGHMEEVKRRLGFVGSPRVFHSSPAEDSAYAPAYNSAKARHPDRAWPDPRLFDFLNLVVRKEPVVVRGALGFETRLIGTSWADGPTDGLGGHGGRVERRGGGTAGWGGSGPGGADAGDRAIQRGRLPGDVGGHQLPPGASLTRRRRKASLHRAPGIPRTT